MTATYAELRPVDRVAAIEQSHEAILKAKHEPPLEAIPSASETWLQRMKFAVVDPEVSQQSLCEMVAAFNGYLAGLTSEERKAVFRHLKPFIEIAELMPPDARDVQDVFDAIFALRRKLGLE